MQISPFLFMHIMQQRLNYSCCIGNNCIRLLTSSLSFPLFQVSVGAQLYPQNPVILVGRKLNFTLIGDGNSFLCMFLVHLLFLIWQLPCQEGSSQSPLSILPLFRPNIMHGLRLKIISYSRDLCFVFNTPLVEMMLLFLCLIPLNLLDSRALYILNFLFPSYIKMYSLVNGYG